MTPSRFEKELTAASPEFRAGVPLHMLLDEAIDVAGATARYWKPSGVAPNNVPGLTQAGPRIRLGIQQELAELVGLARAAHTDYLLAVSPGLTTELLAEAHALCDTMEATLEYLFDDGADDAKDLQLAAVKANDADTIAGRALDLEELAALCDEHRDALSEVELFDLGTPRRAREVARELRAAPPANVQSPEAKAALARRNQVLQVLDARVKKVRAAARFVFRGHPAIVREFTSAYERRRRTDARRARRAKPVVA